jgi:hypothetical protein
MTPHRGTDVVGLFASQLCGLCLGLVTREGHCLPIMFAPPMAQESS